MERGRGREGVIEQVTMNFFFFPQSFQHWQIPLSKRFRALKLWFVIRSYGINGLQKHIRHGVNLAARFEAMVLSDARFEIPAARHLGMVVFRLKGLNDLTEILLKKINTSGKLHCVPASLKGSYVIRFTVTSSHTTLADIERDWDVIATTATIVLAACSTHMINMAGDDQLEKNGVSDATDEPQEEKDIKQKTMKMPLAGKIMCRKNASHTSCDCRNCP